MNKLSFGNRIHRVLLAGLAMLGLAFSSAQAAFVAYDGTTGVVTFTPGDALTPLMTGLVAAVLAGVAVFVLFTGIRWIYSILKRK